MSTRAERTVFLVEDDDAVRDALKMLLRTAGLHLETFASAVAFLQRYRVGRQGVLLLDVRMPEISGLMLQDHLLERGIRLPIVFMSGHGDIAMAVEAVKKGAFDFIEKPFEDYRLLCAVLDALDQHETEQARGARDDAAAERLASLTAREREIFDRILAGQQTRTIATELFISPKTVEFHRGRIKEKLDVASLAELFQRYLPRGLTPN